MRFGQQTVFSVLVALTVLIVQMGILNKINIKISK